MYEKNFIDNMAPKLVFIVCLEGKCSVQGQHQNFKTLGISKFGKDRDAIGHMTFIDLKSNVHVQCFGLFWAFSALKAISKMAISEKIC